jgi:hypothetical protein
MEYDYWMSQLLPSFRLWSDMMDAEDWYDPFTRKFAYTY